MDDAREPGTYFELDEAWNDSGWVRVPNSIARCATLSRRAKGWILEVASHAPGHRLTFPDMIRMSRDGRDATYSTIKEAMEAGYVTRNQDRDINGRLGAVIYRLHVTPQKTSSGPLPGKPDTGKPEAGRPETGRPETSKKTKVLKEQTPKPLVNADASTVPDPPPDDGHADQPPLLELVGSSKAKKPDTTAAFERFWTTYPRRVAKQAARKAWDKAVRVVHDPEVLIGGARRYAQEIDATGRLEYAKHPSTWLNAGCWEDEPAPEAVRRGRNGQISATELPADDWRRWVQE